MNLAELLPRPDKRAHKYSRGQLICVSGSARYPGAAVLAAMAGQRMGAGYVRVLTDESAVDYVRVARPSLVVSSMEELEAVLHEPMKSTRPRAYLLGSGFDPKDSRSIEITTQVLEYARDPVVVDAGALAAYANSSVRGLFAQRADRGWVTVLTPHGGEARALAEGVGITWCDDYQKMAESISQVYTATVVLKSFNTYVAEFTSVGQPRIFAMTEGTAALAKAGSGDVLAGMLSALLAQGLEPFEASVLATTLHARAGVEAARDLTDICVVPEDVIEALPRVIRYMLNT